MPQYVFVRRFLKKHEYGRCAQSLILFNYLRSYVSSSILHSKKMENTSFANRVPTQPSNIKLS